MIHRLCLLGCLAFFATTHAYAVKPESDAVPFVTVLGVAQDGGFPQAGCRRACCEGVWDEPRKHRFVSCLAIVDPEQKQRWMIDATPSFPQQWRMLDRIEPAELSPGLDGVLLTHAHIGHYSGLIHLGREVIGSREVDVFVMPRMRHFLETNGPWSQLVQLKQVRLRRMAAGQEIHLNDRIKVVPFLVPHRDEFSETVGFRIRGPSRTVIFLPDIDKWSRWDVAIEDLLKDADLAYLDGTFFDANELPGRDMAEIPHPFVVESIDRFKHLPDSERSKVRFIHLNHSNPLLDPNSAARARVRDAGHEVAKQGERFSL